MKTIKKVTRKKAAKKTKAPTKSDDWALWRRVSRLVGETMLISGPIAAFYEFSSNDSIFKNRNPVEAIETFIETVKFHLIAEPCRVTKGLLDQLELSFAKWKVARAKSDSRPKRKS